MKQPKRRKRMDPNTVLLIRKIMGGVLAMVFVSLLIWATWYVTRIQALTIQEVSVSGGMTISHELIEELALAELEGDYFGLIPRQFSLLYPKESILSVVGQVDRIKAVRIQKESLTKLSIEFDEYVPDSLWCREEVEKCVFLDVSGYAFATAPSLTGGSFLRLDKLGVEPVTDVQVFEPELYARIKELVSLLEENTWFVRVTAVDVAGDAYLTLADGGELKVALEDEPEQIVENLFTVLGSPEFAEIGPGDFQYIDLRYGNKVFVNEVAPEIDLPLATTTEVELE